MLLFVGTQTASAASPTLRPEVEDFIEHMVNAHGYDRRDLQRLFARVEVRDSILRAMSTPGTARPWHEFRRRMVDSVRVEGGVRFWKENAATLERASREFGVAPEIIVATIGIETLYGRHMGTFRVLDALATLGFDYPPRAEFFRGELEQYLLLVRESPLDPNTLRGSFAGAIGIPQFLPSSYRKYAVDFDGDGRRDLVNSTADAIGSVANYYRAFGWRTGGTIAVPAESGEAQLAPLIAAGIKPHVKVQELRARGLVIPATAQPDEEAAVFSVQTEDGPQLWVGLNNFYVITRYNRSVNYAMAVSELAATIKAGVQGGANRAR